MTLSSWRYFLSLELDFVKTINYVELSPANARSYSYEYAKLLLLIGSEVDTVAKMLCLDINPKSKAGNIIQYQNEICTRFKGFETVEIDIHRYGISVKPWATWGNAPPQSPDWWKSYNGVKHARDANFSAASQSAVTGGLCGLLCLHLYLHRANSHLQPYPELLEFDFPETLVMSGNGKVLPGI